ncbi:mitochondrial 39-S ribosomal protein L47 (MRP-L47)-domain-containing protein [Ephemerocybe angulata]|uniref:Large ribosomal subunit protein uL29m n=1 Tax=Ephemerocybe angulata TaxID=980116 RepID=A0A8H6I101_9AGAR|nr:mitochondrial 39-S ribosomal protein L47 (MRP-L47)-domain-containing protein [Tulosesus angulatus]
MLSLARSSARRTLAQPLCRALATETTQIPAHARPQGNDVDASSAWRKGKIPVKEDHGLYAFFRRKANTKETGEDAYETVESPKKEISGRAWRASELRLKSFKDLHTLWYVTLRERNLLASQREEARKAGYQD